MKLEIGYKSAFEIRSEELTYDGKQPLRIVYMSDLHFNAYSAPMVANIVQEVKQTKPDVLLLGGDYADTKKGLVHLNELLKSFAGIDHVMAVAGNHDYFFGIETLKNIMLAHKIVWIEKKSVQISVNGCSIQIDGNMITGKEHKADLKILCLHKPLDIETIPGYDVAFAGHLHGSQFVAWQTEKGLFPGRFFYKWNRLKTTVNNCRYYISKGLGDTLPIRYNCPKDLIVINLKPEA
ncbi:MAG: metallophosphoesterase [Bacteroidota bacterium]